MKKHVVENKICGISIIGVMDDSFPMTNNSASWDLNFLTILTFDFFRNFDLLAVETNFIIPRCLHFTGILSSKIIIIGYWLTKMVNSVLATDEEERPHLVINLRHNKTSKWQTSCFHHHHTIYFSLQHHLKIAQS